MYDYNCEFCEGIVKKKVVRRELFKHRLGFVILENVPIGVCDQCGYRYYHAKLLHRVEAIALKQIPYERLESVPVVTFA